MMSGKKFLRTTAFVIAIVFLLSGAVFAAGGAKNIKAFYQNIKIIINGSQFNTDKEPFIYDSTTYVPLRVITEAMGADVKWDGATHTISITKPQADPAEIANLKAQLVQKDNRIKALEYELNNALSQLKDQKEAESTLGELEDNLNDDFDLLEDVEIDDIILEGDEDEIEVLVEVDLDGDNLDEWAKLSDDEIFEWLEDLVSDVQDEYSEDTEVTGEIFDTEEDETLVEFKKDGEDDLEVDFYDESYRDPSEDIKAVEDALDNDIYIIDGYEFKVDYVDYDVNTDEIVVDLFDVSGEFITEEIWEGLDREDVEDDVLYICEDIADEFIDEAGVEPERVFLNVYDEKWRELEQFEYDVDNDELE